MNRTIAALLFFSLTAVPTAFAKVGGGDITFNVSGAASVVYRHEEHVIKARLKCSDCHYKIFPMSPSSGKATMRDMEKGLECGACHNGTRAFAVKANCEKCHS